MLFSILAQIVEGILHFLFLKKVLKGLPHPAVFKTTFFHSVEPVGRTTVGPSVLMDSKKKLPVH